MLLLIAPPPRRPANKLKPNTRFLRTIIKGTDRHNKALLAKEQSEAQARLKDLAQAEEEKRRRYRPTAGEIRGRQLGNIAALLGGGGAPGGAQKRKRPAPTDDSEASEMQKERAAHDAKRREDMEAARRRQRDKSGKRRRSLERYTVRRDKNNRGEDDEEEFNHRRNSSSSSEEEGRKRRRKGRSRSPESGPRKHRHRSPLSTKGKNRDVAESSDRSSRKSEPAYKSARIRNGYGDADSDPLEDLIGPALPPKSQPRGRGALKGSSGMDSRFSSDYDPKSDVQLEDDIRDDWDDALEALRDRAKFRQQGADRLREAGFTEDQVKKWEKGDEKTIDDVTWAKAGEKREWDRGKAAEEKHG